MGLEPRLLMRRGLFAIHYVRNLTSLVYWFPILTTSRNW